MQHPLRISYSHVRKGEKFLIRMSTALLLANPCSKSTVFFHPKVGIDFTELLKANENVKDVFGVEIPDLNQSVVAETIRLKTGEHEKEVQDQYHVLVTHALPGPEILANAVDMIRAVRTGSEEQTILLFNSRCKELKEAVKRAAELTRHLTEPARADLKRAGKVITVMWPFLVKETDFGNIFL